MNRRWLGAATMLLLIAGPTFASTRNIWLSSEEIALLPDSAAVPSAWTNLKTWANKAVGVPTLNQDDSSNVITLAKALFYVRSGNSAYRDSVISVLNRLRGMFGQRDLGGGLGPSRKLATYVIAADIAELHGSDSTVFRAWCDSARYRNWDGSNSNVTYLHKNRPNNFGTHAGASRAALAIYVQDSAALDSTATVFHGWVGDRSSYADFTYGSLNWQCHQTRPVGIDSTDCEISGHVVDGALPEEMRRGSDAFKWPPPHPPADPDSLAKNYSWGAYGSAMTQAEILSRRGYDTLNWQNKALRRAAQWMAYLDTLSGCGN